MKKVLWQVGLFLICIGSILTVIGQFFLLKHESDPILRGICSAVGVGCSFTGFIGGAVGGLLMIAFFLTSLFYRLWQGKKTDIYRRNRPGADKKENTIRFYLNDELIPKD